MCDTNPLSVILVKNGSKGDRLLFRYPYNESRGEPIAKIDSDHKWEKLSPSSDLSYMTIADKKSNRYALTVSDNYYLQRTFPSSSISNGQLVGFPDKVLSNIFAVKTQLCGDKFELKVNDVRFVGHPTLLQQSNSSQISPKRQLSTIILFNIIFALRANASHSIVRCYHDLSHRLGIALRHEERRCSYLSKEAKIMLTAHDEVLAMPEDGRDSPFHIILQRSQLARDLKTAYEDLCSNGIVHLFINKWIEISFCLPHRVHRLHNRDHVIEPEALQTCLDALKPYHAMLLLVDKHKLLKSLSSDASPALVRLIHVTSPLKSLQELSADADLTLTQVFQLAGHLVYWAQAIVIYPLCESNVYVLSPHAPTSVNSALVEEFNEKFPGANLLGLMSDFSLPLSLSQRGNPTNLPHQQIQQVQMIVWMLQHNLLMQLHTYVYLVPTAQGSSLLTDGRHREVRQSTPDDATVVIATSDSDLGSVASDEFSPSPSNNRSNEGSLMSDDVFIQKCLLSDLSAAERESIMKVSAASNPEDLRLFIRLCPYFCGRYHLEEIMYFENVRRSQLLTLIDKFREVLITCQHEDDAASVFFRHSKI